MHARIKKNTSKKFIRADEEKLLGKKKGRCLFVKEEEVKEEETHTRYLAIKFMEAERKILMRPKNSSMGII